MRFLRSIFATSLLAACSPEQATHSEDVAKTEFLGEKKIASDEMVSMYLSIKEKGTFLGLFGSTVSNVKASISGCASSLSYQNVPVTSLKLYKGDNGCRVWVESLTVDGVTFDYFPPVGMAVGETTIYKNNASSSFVSLTVENQLSSPLGSSPHVSLALSKVNVESAKVIDIDTLSLTCDKFLITEGGTGSLCAITRKLTDKTLSANITLSGADGRYHGVPSTVTFSPGETSKTFTVSANDNGENELNEEILIRIEDGFYLLSNEMVSITVKDKSPQISFSQSTITAGVPVDLGMTASKEAFSVSSSVVSGPSGAILNFYYVDSALWASASMDGIYVVEAQALAVNGETASAQITLNFDVSAPVINAFNLMSPALDGMVNVSDRNSALPMASTPAVIEFSSFSVSYKLVLSTAFCSAQTGWSSSIPLTSDSGMATGNYYVICAKVVDAFGRTTYAQTAAFGYDESYPTATITGAPSGASRLSSVSLTIGGTGVLHYQYKITSSLYDCQDQYGYSADQNVSSPLLVNTTPFEGGSLFVCVVGVNAASNYQPLNVLTSRNWIVDLSPPQAVENFMVSSLVERIALSFSANQTDTSGYLIVRSSQQSFSFVPSHGTSYSKGQVIGGDTVVHAGAFTRALDDLKADYATYYYAIYAYDAVFNYSTPSVGTGAATAPVTFNQSAGFDRYVRRIIASSYYPGKYYVFGDFTQTGNNTSLSKIIRIDDEGAVDTSFVPKVIDGTVMAAVEDSQGRVYVAGSFRSINRVSRVRVARLLTNGTLDSTFVTTSTSGGPNNTVISIDLDESLGRLYIGGSFTAIGSVAVRYLGALTLTGGLDTTFIASGGPSASVSSIKRDRINGGLYVGGGFTKYPSTATVTTNTTRIMKVNSDGTLNTSFATGSGASSTVNDIQLDSFGNVYIVGAFTSYKGSSSYKYLSRLTSTGEADTSFAVVSKFNATLNSIHIDEANGHIYVSGSQTKYGTVTSNRITKLFMDTAGSLDSAFASAVGAGPNAAVNTTMATPTGVFWGGAFLGYQSNVSAYLVKTSRGGEYLSGWATGAMFNSSTTCFAKGSSADEIYVGGAFTLFKNINSGRLARMNKSGVPDSSYTPIFNSTVSTLLYQQSSGKLYAGGSFTTHTPPRSTTTSSVKYIAKLNYDGTRDASFQTSIGPNGAVTSMAFDKNGMIYIAGSFSAFGSAKMKYVARIDASGNLDTSFNPNPGTSTGLNAAVTTILPTADGGVILGGSFTSFNYNGTTISANRIIKLDSTGAPDASFYYGTGFNNTVRRLFAYDGGIYVGGDFTSYNGVSKNRITKVGFDGIVDSSFSIGTGFNNAVYWIDYDDQSNRLAVVGSFSSYKTSNKVGKIALISSTGAFDASMAPTPGFSATPTFVLPTYYGLLVAGGFVNYKQDASSENVLNDFISLISYYGLQY